MSSKRQIADVPTADERIDALGEKSATAAQKNKNTAVDARLERESKARHTMFALVAAYCKVQYGLSVRVDTDGTRSGVQVFLADGLNARIDPVLTADEQAMIEQIATMPEQFHAQMKAAIYSGARERATAEAKTANATRKAQITSFNLEFNRYSPIVLAALRSEYAADALRQNATGYATGLQGARDMSALASEIASGVRGLDNPRDPLSEHARKFLMSVPVASAVDSE